MKIRKFNSTDINPIISLFYETVHAVNKQHYSQEQLDAWAHADEETHRRTNWNVSLSRNITYVAEVNDIIVGFADLTQEGHLDRLYIHKDYQGQGIGSTLVDKLESEARRLGLVEVDTEASITAVPFFESKGYRIIKSQDVKRRGIELVNFKMTKDLLNCSSR